MLTTFYPDTNSFSAIGQGDFLFSAASDENRYYPEIETNFKPLLKSSEPGCSKLHMEYSPTCEEETWDQPVKDYIRAIENKNICDHHKSALDSLLKKYEKLFIFNDTQMPESDLLTYHINTFEHPPIYLKPYPILQSRREWCYKRINELLKAGIIVHSSSPWSSPATCALKPPMEHERHLPPEQRTGSAFRLCVDYSKTLNVISEPYQWSMNSYYDIISELDNIAFMSHLDMYQAFHHCKISPSSQEKTAFTIHGLGHFHWTRLNFGMSQSPKVFSRLVDLALFNCRGFTLNFLDDLICYTKWVKGASIEEMVDLHLQHLEKTFIALQKANLSLKLEKCKFLLTEMVFLGHEISRFGVKTDRYKIAKMLDKEFPKNRKLCKSVNSLFSYYRDFIPHFSKKIKPLLDLANSKKFEPDQKCYDAWDTLKTSLCNTPILSYPKVNVPFRCYCDSSEYSWGAVITQLHNHNGGQIEKPVMFLSALYQNPALKWNTTEKELWSILRTLERLRPWLVDSDVLICSDHLPLKSFINSYKHMLKDPKLWRWRMRLSEYRLHFVWQSGKSHWFADLMSRPDITVEKDPFLKNKQTQTEFDHPPSGILNMDDQPLSGILNMDDQPQSGILNMDDQSQSGILNMDDHHPSGVLKMEDPPPTLNNVPCSSTSIDQYNIDSQNFDDDLFDQVHITMVGNYNFYDSTTLHELPPLCNIGNIEPLGYCEANVNIQPSSTFSHGNVSKANILLCRDTHISEPSLDDASFSVDHVDSDLYEECSCHRVSHAQISQIRVPDSPPGINIDKLKLEQSKDTQCMDIMGKLRGDTASEHVRKHYVILDNVLYHINYDIADFPRVCVWVPGKTMRDQILDLTHGNSHYGVVKQWRLLKKSYFWPSMYVDLLRKNELCIPCKENNLHKIKSPLGEAYLPQFVGHTWSCDLIGPLNRAYDNSVYCLTMVEEVSSWVEVYTLKSRESKEVASRFLNDFWPQHFGMICLRSDNGETKSKIFSDICTELSIKHIFTSPMSPQSNSKCELVNKALKKSIRCCSDRDPLNWPNYISQFCASYRIFPCIQEESPFYLYHGRQAICNLHRFLAPRPKYLGDEEHLLDLEKYHIILNRTLENLRKSKMKNKKYYDRSSFKQDIKIGDPVFFKSFVRTKMENPWESHYVVTEKRGEKSWVIQNTLTKRYQRCKSDDLIKAKFPWNKYVYDYPGRGSRYAFKPDLIPDKSEHSSDSELSSSSGISNTEKSLMSGSEHVTTHDSTQRARTRAYCRRRNIQVHALDSDSDDNFLSELKLNNVRQLKPRVSMGKSKKVSSNKTVVMKMLQTFYNSLQPDIDC